VNPKAAVKKASQKRTAKKSQKRSKKTGGLQWVDSPTGKGASGTRHPIHFMSQEIPDGTRLTVMGQSGETLFILHCKDMSTLELVATLIDEERMYL